jgi:hypothetical protein
LAEWINKKMAHQKPIGRNVRGSVRVRAIYSRCPRRRRASALNLTASGLRAFLTEDRYAGGALKLQTGYAAVISALVIAVPTPLGTSRGTSIG